MVDVVTIVVVGELGHGVEGVVLGVVVLVAVNVEVVCAVVVEVEVVSAVLVELDGEVVVEVLVAVDVAGAVLVLVEVVVVTSVQSTLVPPEGGLPQFSGYVFWQASIQEEPLPHDGT
jgi:hypothetical protein